MSKRGRKGRGISVRRLCRGLPTSARLIVADNSGAKVVELIAVIGWQGRLRRQPAASVSDMIVVTCKVGSEKMRHQVLRAIIIRQRRPFRRVSGQWIRFEDNAAVITSETGDPQGSEIRGPVAREAAERWPRVASVASIIV